MVNALLAESKQDIRSLYESFCKQDETVIIQEDIGLVENDTNITVNEEIDDTYPHRHTIRG